MGKVEFAADKTKKNLDSSSSFVRMPRDVLRVMRTSASKRKETTMKRLLLLMSAVGLVSCSGITDVKNEPGTRYAGIDPVPRWVVVKAEDATYSPFLVPAIGKDGYNQNADSAISVGLRALTTDAQDLVVRKGNEQLEINQPVFSKYGPVKVGDVGGVLYVTNNAMQNNVWRSNKKKYPRFVPSRAFGSL